MILLASQSPRRAELLTQLQVPFRTIRLEIDESRLHNEDPTHFVTRLAEQKAQAGWSQSDQSAPVLGSDTIVVVGDKVLGKPVDKQDALDMLSLLSGRQHEVMTAVAVTTGETCRSVVSKTKVRFKVLSETEKQWYWSTGEPADKAGSYGIQGLAGQFVEEIHGSYSAVVGLPLFETSQLLQEMGIKIHEC